MRLRLPASVLALTTVFVALPTVQLPAHADTPVPVAPKVVNSPVVDADAHITPAPVATKATTASPLAPRQKEVVTELLDRPKFTVAGVSWSQDAGVSSKDLTVQVRLLERGRWSAWETLTVPDDGPDVASAEGANARVGTAPIVTDGATGVQVKAASTTAVPTDLRVTTIDPGTSAADDDLTKPTPAGAAVAAAAKPTIITRKQWGADEKLRRAATMNKTVKAITIHHTAGSNSYTSATAAAQVRGIYAYDTKGLGWADIAYNFLVDKYGRIYEGRAGSITSAVRGAHAMGFNVDTMGVAAMGNYETAKPPAVMVDAIAKVTGWKLSQYGANVTGKVTLTSQGGSGAKYAAGKKATLDVVNAHQNTSYTLCPGKYLYPLMGSIRTKAANYAKYSSLTVPKPAPKPAAKVRVVGGLDSDGKGDAIGRTLDGGLYYYKGGKSTFSKGVKIGSGWNIFAHVFSTGDFTGDGKGDVIGVEKNGNMWVYPGRGNGKVLSSRKSVGKGWNMFNLVFGPGDLTGDGKNDILGRKPNGELWLYTGNGKAYVSSRKVVATGMQKYVEFITPGDFNGDKKADLLGRTKNGKLWLLPGTGKGTFGTAKQIGTGWQIFNRVISVGDVTGDGKNDVIGRTPSGRSYIYAGTGKGYMTAGKVFTAPWGDVTYISGVR